MIELFFTGILIGFLIALPLGPIAVLSVQYSLRRGVMYGLAAGLGATFADAIFAIVVGLGITIITSVMKDYGPWLQLIGAIIFGYLGVKIFLEQPQHTVVKTQRLNLVQVFLSTFFITITSPSTFLIFVGIYTVFLGPLGSIGLASTFVLTLGVILGSAVWAVILSNGAFLLGKKFDTTFSSPWVNVVSGTIIIIFACVIAVSAFTQFVG